MNQGMLGTVELPEGLYYKFARLVYDMAGISLGDTKRELVRSRLLKRLRALGMDSFEEYYEYLSGQDAASDELVQMLDVISTNKTDFFRENQHFEFLSETVLPGIIRKAIGRNNRRIRIWSAGCSSGEEPYTLGMVLSEALGGQTGWDAKILASDLSTRVLRMAFDGVYEEEKLEPVPPQYRLAYFTKEKNNGRNCYRAKPELRDLITFRRLNLMNPTFPFSGKFDIIFCRNVMIYFDKPTQESLINKFHRYMQPGGYLFIGHSESLTSLKTPFQFIKPTIYMKPL